MTRPYQRPRPRRRLARRIMLGLTSVAVVAITFGGYVIYRGLTRQAPFIPAPGCVAGSGSQSVPLSPGQAAIASTIAAVAVRDRLPQRALTIAFATALQESDLADLDYGDRDSVGVFQQRPSQGWGTDAEIEDPVYATSKFFAALVKIHGYPKLQVWQAAQAVQRSADGPAYQQYAQVAAVMAADFDGTHKHAVACWYTPGTRPADYRAAVREMTAAFGSTAGGGALLSDATVPSGKSRVLEVRSRSPWTAASWLVTHSSAYGITRVRYGGYQWTAAPDSTGWQKDHGQVTGSIVAS